MNGLPILDGQSDAGHGRRLLWIHQNFVSAREPGNSRPIHILAALLEQGFSVDVVTTQAGYLHEGPPPEQAKVVIEQEGRLTIHRLRHGGGLHRRGWSYLSFLARCLRYLPRIGHVDLVYASTPPLPQVLLHVAASVWKRAPMLLEVRDLWPAFLAESGLLRFPPWIMALEWIETLAYRYADHCVSVSPAFSAYLRGLGVSGERLSVVPTGGDPHYLRLDRADGLAWRRANGLEGKFLVLYTGSFNEAYALETALAAAAALRERRPEVVWLFAGNGRRRAEIEAAAGRLGCVRYLGSAPKDELPPLYLAADVGLVSLAQWPSLMLVMPGKLFDYLAAGLPVVSTNAGLAGAVVTAAQAGVVLPAPTAEHLAEAVLQMADLPCEARRAMGARGQQWVLREMNCAAMARQIAQLAAVACQQRSRGWRLLRSLNAGLLACGDTLRRRPAKVLRRLLQQDLRQFTSDSLQQWLAARPAPAAHDQPLAVPALLSSREAS